MSKKTIYSYRTIVNGRAEIQHTKITNPYINIIWFPLNAPPPAIGSEKADMYLNMCVEILSRWGSKTKCNINKSRRYIKRLLLLTSEASMRCR